MLPQVQASVVVSFYNNTNALKRIILALEKQQSQFEIVIADDGSKQNNVDILESIISNSSLRIKHVWQQDCGFRKNRILNKAVKAASGDYLIFIDGDCIPQANFVNDHINNSQKGYVLNGRRVDLASSFKEQLYNEDNPELFFKKKHLAIVWKYFVGQGKNVEKGFRITQPTLSRFLNRKNKGIVGCNFSLFKDDLLAVNGFDNRYEVPGVGEDSDIEYRLIHNGIKIKNLFYQANILHLMHPELTRIDIAYEIFAETRKAHQIVAIDGYEQAHNVE